MIPKSFFITKLYSHVSKTVPSDWGIFFGFFPTSSQDLVRLQLELAPGLHPFNMTIEQHNNTAQIKSFFIYP